MKNIPTDSRRTGVAPRSSAADDARQWASSLEWYRGVGAAPYRHQLRGAHGSSNPQVQARAPGAGGGDFAESTPSGQSPVLKPDPVRAPEAADNPPVVEPLAPARYKVKRLGKVKNPGKSFEEADTSARVRGIPFPLVPDRVGQSSDKRLGVVVRLECRPVRDPRTRRAREGRNSAAALSP